MDEKISLDKVARYGDAYADQLIKTFFAGKSKITGPEILKFSEISQINFFVLREIFVAWKDETERQKSAYFDYDDPEVTEALQSFMTVLSNHISLEKDLFVPLARKAVRQALLLLFDPYDFFSALVAGKGNKLDVAAFKDEIKYLKVNKAPLEKMVQKLEERKIKELPGNEAFAVLDQILEEVNFTPEDLEGYIGKFSAVIPLDPSTFYHAAPQPTVAAASESINHTKSDKKAASDKNAEPTLNDIISSQRKPALIDNFQRISRIKDNLTINQKFMFTKVLFYGDFESFSRAIDDLDRLNDMNEALRYLETHSSTWDRECSEFHEFMEMVEKRFS